MHCYLIRYRNRWGAIDEYALVSSCVQHCKDWVQHLHSCTFISATLIV